MKKTVEISSNLKDKFEIDINARKFKMTIDQPEPGGTDKGPTPLEYFLFSLAGCLCSIGRIVAMQKKIELRSMEVKVEGDIDKSQRTGFNDIRAYIKIDAPMSKDEKEAFIQEVDKRCPISDNIENPSTVHFFVEES